MEKNNNNLKKVLKNSGVAKIIFGVTLLYVYPYYGILLILFGLYLFFQSYENEETLFRNKIIYLIVSIIGICDVVGSLIYFVNYEKFSPSTKNANGPPKKDFITFDNENKKIDILLKLGVLMVFLSGLIFATTSWAIISDFTKVIALFLFGLLFIFISIFSQNKLKLYSSSFLYWILGIAFFVFTVIAIIYFDIFAIGISFVETSNLAFGIVLLSISGLLIVTHYKYPDKQLLLIGFLSFIFSIYLLLKHYFSNESIIVGVISFIVLFINILNKNNDELKNKYCSIFTYVSLGISYGYLGNLSGDTNPFVIILLGLIQVFNINYYMFKYKDSDTDFINVCLTYLLLIITFSINTFIFDNYPIIIMLVISLYTFLLNMKIMTSDIDIIKKNYYIYSGASLFLTLKGFDEFSGIGISLIYLIMNFIFAHNIIKIDEFDFLKYFESASIGLFIISISSLINIDNNTFLGLSIASIVLSLIYYVYLQHYKDDCLIKVYPITIALINIYILLFNSDDIIWVYLVDVFTSLFLFLVTFSDTTDSNKIKNYAITYVLLLSSICYPFIINNVLDLNLLVITVLYLLVLLLIIYIIKNKTIFKITLIYFVIPLYNLVENGFDNFVIEVLINNMLGFYLLFIVLYFFFDDYNVKSVLAIIGLLLLMLKLIDVSDVLVFIYVGIVGLVYIIIGFKNNKFNKLFFAGVLVIIFDIIKSLWDVWRQIPSWLYLLIVGLSIISFAMYREINKKK